MKYISDQQLRILEKQAIECCDLEDMMCDYADGDLTESLKERLDAHAKTCPACMEFRDSYLKTIEIASCLKPKELDTNAKNRLREALNQRLGINLTLTGS